jgi:hypothetical protein
VVLALCAAAVVAGMCSFTASAGWVVDVPAELLAQLYGQRAESPSKATIWRVVTGADPAVVDAVIGAWLAQQSAAQESAAAEPTVDSCTLVAMAVDGKTVRGATDSEGNRVHLLAAATHQDALVLGQVEVGAKTGEIPMFAPLLDTLANAGVDLSRAVITADALHTSGPTPSTYTSAVRSSSSPQNATSPGCSPRSTHWPGPRFPSPPATSIPVTAGSPPAPSRSCPHPPTCHSRTSTRSG